MELDDTLIFEQWLHSNNAIDEPSSITFADAVLNEEDTIYPPQSSAVTSSRPLKQQKNSNWDSSNSLDSNLKYNNKRVLLGTTKPKEEISWSSFSPEFINFDSTLSFDSKNHMLKPCQGTKRVMTSNICTSVRDTKPKSFSLAQEHILAERKRRERINERLISLSKLIPGLSKMDKATVLADAIKYIKQLQERVKFLEEKTDKIKAVQSQVVVKTYEVCTSDRNIRTSSDETSSDDSVTTRDLVPEIEARVCDRDVLITIHCKKKKGVVDKIVAEIERIHLTVVNSSVMSFGDSALNTIVVAQMDEEFTMNMNQLVNNLHGALGNL